MKIVDVKIQTFRHKTRVVPDSEGHAHPGEERDTTQTMLTIVTDEGAEGYAFGPDPSLVEGVIRPILLGEDVANSQDPATPALHSNGPAA